jgi:hypothetical protein
MVLREHIIGRFFSGQGNEARLSKGNAHEAKL